MYTQFKTFFILLLCSITTSLYSQDSNKSDQSMEKEVGLVFGSLDNFGLTYRIGKEENFWRFNSLFLSGGQTVDGSILDNYLSSAQNVVNRQAIGFSTSVGREHRQSIHEKVQLRYGNDLLFEYNYQKFKSGTALQTTSKAIDENWSVGLGFVLGFNYMINKAIIIGAEVVPSISYFQRRNDNNGLEIKNTGINYGLSNNSSLISLIFRY